MGCFDGDTDGDSDTTIGLGLSLGYILGKLEGRDVSGIGFGDGPKEDEGDWDGGGSGLNVFSSGTNAI